MVDRPPVCHDYGSSGRGGLKCYPEQDPVEGGRRSMNLSLPECVGVTVELAGTI